MSLKSRFNLMITLLMVFFVAALAVIEVDDARRSIREETEAASRIAEQMLRRVIQSESQNANSLERILRFLSETGRIIANDISVFDRHGKLIYASPASRYKAGRNAPRWYAAIVAPHPHASEVALVGGTLYLKTEPSRSILDAWDDLVALLELALVFFVIINAVVFWFVGRGLRPLKEFVRGMQQVEQGQFHTRLARFQLPEFQLIGDSFNRMAQAVEESISVRKKAAQTERQLEDNRELTQLIQTHIEEERRSLASELHDELGQYVTAITAISTSIAQRSEKSAPELSANARTISDLSGQIYDTMHRMIRRLRPMPLDNLGLGEALIELADSTRLAHPDIELDLNCYGELEGLGETVNITVYRLAQESISNIVRHSGARRASIEVRRLADSHTLEINITDDGHGLEPGALTREGHFGLRGMRERVAALHGSFEISSGRGVVILVRLPLDSSNPGVAHGTQIEEPAN